MAAGLERQGKEVVVKKSKVDGDDGGKIGKV
jgi:hypothetical protein